MANRKVLVTGAAGFIGAFLVKKLLEETDDVIVGLDNLNSYYDPGIKDARLRMLAEVDTDGRFAFVRGDLCDAALIERLFVENGFEVVVNLAAQAGVRYSIENPRAYLESNLVGFFNVLEACRHHPVRHLVYASSSSVYGGNKKVPFSEEDRVDSPVSLYAATKKSNELMAAAYSKLYSIPATGLRFFTVYGPMGRPDMAYFGFTEKLRRGETIKIFNMGDCRRDFTYVDDIVEGVRRVMDAAPEVKMGDDGLPLGAHRVYNIGNSHPENLLYFVDTLQRVLVEEGVLPADYDFEAHKQLVPMQPGDVPVTYADTTALQRDLGYKPATPLEDGLRAFAKWYREYRKLSRNTGDIMPQSEKYSFLISVYAKEEPQYLSEAFSCMLNQSYAPDEIVLVCDGPLTDGLESVISRVKDTYGDLIKLVRISKNGGLGNALAVGLLECRNELIARMDSDDLCSLQRIERQINYLRQHPEVSLVGSNAIEFVDDPKKPVAYVVLPETNEEIRAFSAKRCAFRHPAILFRKKAVLSAGGYRGTYMWFEDTDLYGRMLANGCICHNIQENLLQVRVSEDFYKRRGGIPYLKSMCLVKWELVELGLSSKLDFLISAGGQILVCAMPNFMREAFYKTFLRK